jgi:hypothetical protein
VNGIDDLLAENGSVSGLPWKRVQAEEAVFSGKMSKQ